MKAKDFTSGESPWFSESEFLKWAESMGVISSQGERYNRTDGEVHLVLKHSGGAEYELHANYWRYSWRWQEAIDWVEAQGG